MGRAAAIQGYIVTRVLRMETLSIQLNSALNCAPIKVDQRGRTHDAYQNVVTTGVFRSKMTKATRLTYKVNVKKP